jgi:hypothetical protein
MFGGLTVVMSLVVYFRHKGRSDMQQTIRLALDKGHELSPEIIDRLGHPKASKYRDMRLGIIWLSLAVALVLCGFAINEPDALRGILAGAAFPFCIGAAYLINYRLTGQD